MMERLTERIINKETGEVLAYRTLPNVSNLKATQQLGRYEDTGLTPEQVQGLKELDTAKIPNYEGDGYDNQGNLIYDTWICPNCEEYYEVDYDRYDFCPKCGQRLDWSE